jgi:hypothetical protein
MSVKVTDETKIKPVNISTSLECSSKNYKDEENNTQFQAISFYVNDTASDWIL